MHVYCNDFVVCVLIQLVTVPSVQIPTQWRLMKVPSPPGLGYRLALILIEADNLLEPHTLY